jgi:hypothetical protein
MNFEVDIPDLQQASSHEEIVKLQIDSIASLA